MKEASIDFATFVAVQIQDSDHPMVIGGKEYWTDSIEDWDALYDLYLTLNEEPQVLCDCGRALSIRTYCNVCDNDE